MQTYSPFFQTLHDELAPVGTLGRGTHYSVLRGTVFQSPYGSELPQAAFHDFAIIWDEDHDTRVLTAIESVYHAKILPSFIIFGERKGILTAILSEKIRQTPIIDAREKTLSEIVQSVGNDVWTSYVSDTTGRPNAIISDSDDKVDLYLRNIQMLWSLGSKKATAAVRDANLSADG